MEFQVSCRHGVQGLIEGRREWIALFPGREVANCLQSFQEPRSLLPEIRGGRIRRRLLVYPAVGHSPDALFRSVLIPDPPPGDPILASSSLQNDLDHPGSTAAHKPC